MCNFFSVRFFFCRVRFACCQFCRFHDEICKYFVCGFFFQCLTDFFFECVKLIKNVYVIYYYDI